MSPPEVDACTLWEYACAYDGYVKANSPQEDAPPPMSDDRLKALGIEGFA